MDGAFDVVYLVFNTIGNLASQEAQVACFANAAAHLRPGGCFVIETGAPGGRREDRFRIFDHSDEHLGIDQFDTATQLMYSHHYTRQDDGLYRRRSIPFRYASPAEYDLMARLAGMRLRERWSDFRRTRSPLRARDTCRCGRSRSERGLSGVMGWTHAPTHRHHHRRRP